MSLARLSLEAQCKAAGLTVPVCEMRFHPTRRWRFDYAWPKQALALEVDGGVYVTGRHTRGAGVEADMEKYNEAALLGWTVLRVSTRHVLSGAALNWIEQALRMKSEALTKVRSVEEALQVIGVQK